jgi:hypothetical protein
LTTGVVEVAVGELVAQVPLSGGGGGAGREPKREKPRVHPDDRCWADLANGERCRNPIAKGNRRYCGVHSAK